MRMVVVGDLADVTGFALAGIPGIVCVSEPEARASVATWKSRPKPTASLKRMALVPLLLTSTSFGMALVPISSTVAGARIRTPSSSPPFASIWLKRA